MTKAGVLELLEANGNVRGMKHWEKLGSETMGLSSFGIGLTQLRKLAKRIVRNHELALQLWDSDNYDAKIIGLLIDEPKKLSPEQAESQVEDLGMGLLSHVFSSCDATPAKTPFAFELASEWIESADTMRRRCGYGLIYELSKNVRIPELTDQFFLKCIQRIRSQFDSEDAGTRLAMGSALIGIGKPNKTLNQAALALAKELGPIDFSEDDRKCDPLEVSKHLASETLKKRLGL